MSHSSEKERALSGTPDQNGFERIEPQSQLRDDVIGTRRQIRREVFPSQEPGRNQRVIEYPPRDN
jgi:hypothetical protein